MPFIIPDLLTRIESERLYLRPFQAGDGGWYYATGVRNHYHLQKYEAENAINGIRSEEDAERVVRGFVADWIEGKAFFLAVFGRETREFVAQMYIGVVNRKLPEFEVGFFADVDHEGQGYVSEAVGGVLTWLFRDLDARRVRLECDDTNERSARVAKRCGFVREGHIRENHLWPDGSITGTLHYGLLRTEYRG